MKQLNNVCINFDINLLIRFKIFKSALFVVNVYDFVLSNYCIAKSALDVWRIKMYSVTWSYV